MGGCCGFIVSLLDKIGYEKEDSGDTSSGARRKLLCFFFCFLFIFFPSSTLGIALFICVLKYVFNIVYIYFYIWCVHAPFLYMTQ